MAKIGSEALTPNLELEPFKVLIGKWRTEGSHPLIPGVILHGLTSFEWIEGGSFLMMRSEIDEPDIPSGIAIIGSDNVLKKYFMLYFDERGISRMYNVSLYSNQLKWWRDAPGFSQRFTGTLTNGDKTIIGKGELSKDESNWEKDLELTYSRFD